jgi:hypothetical protein
MKELSPERSRAVREVFEAALELADGERETFLDRTADGDAELRGEVRLLLAAYRRAGGFLRTPAGGCPAPPSDAHVFAAVDPAEDPGELHLRPGVDPGGVPQRGLPFELRAGRAVEPDQVGDVLLAIRDIAPGAGRGEELEDEEQLDRRHAHPSALLSLVERGAKEGWWSPRIRA